LRNGSENSARRLWRSGDVLLPIGQDEKQWRLRFCRVLALLVIGSGSMKPPASEIGWLLALEHAWLGVRLAILLMLSLHDV